MAFENAKPGLGNVGSYQISGIPFVTGGLSVPGNLTGAMELVFPSVTQRFVIHNDDASNAVRIGYSAFGVAGKKYFLIDAHGNNQNKGMVLAEFRVRTDRIFLLSDSVTAVSGVSVSAELTGIELGFDLASRYSGSAGIG